MVLGSKEAKAGLRSGGIEAARQDALRRAPLREPYAARSGVEPETVGTPETITRDKASRSRRTRSDSKHKK